MSTTADQVAELERLRAMSQDLLEELQLLRAGVPFHVHHDEFSGKKQRCSSPYCINLTMEGIRAGL